jgi:KDO2-lipid IV(A) lauroyltransferase
MVVDWGYRPDDVPVKLFGDWTTLPAGPATLAARTRAVILPVAARRQPDGTFRSNALDPIEVADSSPAGILRATQAIAGALESMVREAPEQWYTFKPMWPSTAQETERLERRAAEMARR